MLNRLHKITLLTIIILLSVPVYAVTTTFNGNTNERWDNASNWTNGIPGVGDDVIIDLPSGGICNLRRGFSYSINSLTINGLFSTLRVLGELTVANTTNLVGFGSEIESRGDVILNGTLILGIISSVNVNNNQGNIIANGDIDFQNGFGSLTTTRNNSTFVINGNLLNSTVASFTFTSGIVTYSGNTSQTIAPTTYMNLSFEGTGQKNINDGNIIVSTAFQANNSVISITSGDLEILAPAGNTDFGTSTVKYEALGNQTIRDFPSPLYNLTVDGTGTKVLATTITDLEVQNNIDILGATLDIDNSNLTLSGNFVNNSVFIQNNSTVSLTGPASSSISGTSSTDFFNLVLAKTAVANTTLESEISITPNGALTLSSTNDNLAITSGDLNLRADASGYSTIAEIPAGSSITGEVNVEAYFGATQRSWWQVSSPVEARAADWIDDILITGDFTGNTNDGVIGDDLQSMYAFDETSALSQNDSWVNFPSLDISESMTLGKGYRVFIRDDALTVSPKTVDLKGNLHQGDLTIPLTYTSTGNTDNDGWNLIGNPYPAALNWGDVDKTSLAFTSAYVWNANLKTYDKFGPDISVAPYQAFFVKANAGENDLLFTESMKTSSVALQRISPEENVLNLTIRESNSNSEVNTASTSVILDNNSTEGLDRDLDAGLLSRNTFIDEGLVEIGTIAKGMKYKKNSLPETTTGHSIPVYIEFSQSKAYEIVINKENYTSDSKVSLYDSYLQESIEIEDEELIYSFNTPDIKSRNSNRFYLRIGSDPLSVSENTPENLKVYPNPSSNGIIFYTLSEETKNASITLSNISGKVVLQERSKTLAESNSINTTGLKPGIYTLSITTENGLVSKKLVIE